MRKTVLALALVITFCNVALGVTFAAVCQSSGGARACGDVCVAQADGKCRCEGGCTVEEKAWVNGPRNIALLEDAAS